jgi:glycosyltransferase involved in cell wall biosynthesis
MYQFFPGGGIGRYTHELASQLLHMPQLEVSVVCSPDFEWLAQARYETITALPSLRHGNSVIRRTRFLGAQFVSPYRLLSLARKRQADVIHLANINHLTFPFWKRLIPANSRLVVTAHDVRRAKKIISRRWEERALCDCYRRCAAVFVHSESQRADLRNFAGISDGQIHTVPHGPYSYPAASGERDKLRRDYGLPVEGDVALCFGSIRDDKNLMNTLLSLKHVPDPPCVLVAGRGGGKGNRSVDWYQQQVREAGLESRVVFLDRYISDEEVGNLFQVSDVALLTYKTSFTSQSGVLNVAMHYGVPVIATPAPTMAESIRQFGVGIVADDEDPTAIASGVRQWQMRRKEFVAARFGEYLNANSWLR